MDVVFGLLILIGLLVLGVPVPFCFLGRSSKDFVPLLLCDFDKINATCSIFKSATRSCVIVI